MISLKVKGQVEMQYKGLGVLQGHRPLVDWLRIVPAKA
jgi:hypothetical protein